MTGQQDRLDADKRTYELAAMFGGALFAVAAVASLLVLRHPVVILVWLVLAAAAGFVALRARERSTQLVLASLQARPITAADRPRLSSLVDGISSVSGIGRPALAVIDSPSVNAVVVGHDRAASTLVVTEGLLGALNRIQLEGVVAHAMSRLDTGEAAIATAAAGTIGLPVTLAERGLSATDGPTLLGKICKPLASAVAPLLDRVLEPDLDVRADLSGIGLTRFPPGLADALEGLAELDSSVPHAPAAVAHLFVLPVRPSADDAPIPSIARRLPEHRPVDQRVGLLREL